MIRVRCTISCVNSGYRRLQCARHCTMLNPLIAVCQMTATSNAEKNLETVRELSAKARSRSACMAFFPEACDYLADNKKDIVAMAEPLNGQRIDCYKEIASSNDIWLSLGGIHEALPDDDKHICNNHILINNEGELESTYRKIHLFDMENKNTGMRLMESEYCIAGDQIVPPVKTPAGLLGLSICYDLRFPELSLSLREMGAQILTYPSAFMYQTGAAHWETLLRARAIEAQCYVVAAAQIGTHNKKRVSWGHSMIIDPWGVIVAQCVEKTGIAVAEIDLELLSQIRTNMPCQSHRRPDLYWKCKN